MASKSAKMYDTKVVAVQQSADYLSFGWLRSKDRVPDGAKVKPKKATPVLMKRKIEFGMNGQLVNLENNYEKLTKKKYRSQPILGILFFLLMIALLAVAGVLLYYGISAGIEAGKYTGTYYYYTEAGDKVETKAFVLEKDTWKAEYKSEEGNLTRKGGAIDLNVTQGEGDEAEDVLTYTAVVKDGILTITTVGDKPTSTRYYTDDCKAEEKSSVIKEEKPANAAEEEEEPADEEAEEEKGGILDTIKGILDKVHDEYLSKVTSIFEGKTNEETGEYTEGIADKVSGMLGSPIGDFISADTLVGVIALLLAIIFIILFAEVCKIKKKRERRNAKVDDILAEAAAIVEHMKRTNPALMPKANRKAFMWENIIANALIRANNYGNDDDDDDDL